MDIFKEKTTPQTSNPSEMMRSQPMGMPFEITPVQPTCNVETAQSVAQVRALAVPASMTDFGARSVEHVDRPRYGHKV